MIRRIGLVLALITILVLGSLTPTTSVQAQTNWYDPDWQYRRPITVSNPGATSLTDYQVLVTLDATFDFSKAESDGADVRITADDGTTLLPFWIETWDAVGEEAKIWVKVNTVPLGDSTLYLYYGNSAANPISDGDTTFEFFDDFESPVTAEGYYSLSGASGILEQDQAWENTAPHTLSVVEVNEGGYQYWGYYALQSGNGGVGLARSNDLINWDKYPSNPLFYNGRFASIIKVGDTYHMAVTKNYGGTSHVVLRTSTDGLNFTEVATLVEPTSGQRNQNPNLFLDPNDGQYYLYWFRYSDQRYIMAKHAANVMDLATSTELTILSSPSVLAAPNMMYYDGSYFLSTEIYEGEWKVHIYESTTSPVSDFVPLPDNPILEDGSACFFQHIFGDTMHAYYCKLTGSTWTVDHRSADLTAGRSELPASLDPSKWMPTGGTWTPETAVQPDGSTGNVARGETTARQILLSSFTGDDYVVDAYGQQVNGRVWGIGVRATDTDNLYFTNLYEDLDTSENLYIYRRSGGNGGQVASTGVGPIDFDTWHRLTIKVHDDDIEAYLDGAPELQGNDSNLTTGSIALYGEGGTDALFDDVRVRLYADQEPTTTIGDPTAVTLASFSAEPDETDIVITWQTTIEIDNVGFNLYRSDAANGPYTQLNEILIPSQAPGSMQGAIYTWRDEVVILGHTYFYQLEDIDVNGTHTYHGPISTIPGTDPNAMRLQRLAAWHTYEAVILGMGALIISIGLVFARRRRSHLS